MDWISSVIRKSYEEKFSCGRSKYESIVVNVLATAAVQTDVRIGKC
jgi:hypothetical protein